MNAIIVLALGGLMHALRSFSVGKGRGSAGSTLALGYVLLSAYLVGGIFKGIGLPRLTGYIATGIIVGPELLGFLTPRMVDSLKIVNGIAISLIALTAGTELELKSMRPLLRTIGWITLVGVLGTTVLLTATVYLARDLLPFMAGMALPQALAVSTVLGVVMVAQSPAVVVALRDEMESEGPVTRTVLGVVVLADLVVISLFALTSTAGKAVLGGRADVLETAGALAWEIPGSLSIGMVIGFVLSLYLRKVRGGRRCSLLMVAFIIAEVGQRLRFDPLLVALAAGMFIRNLTTVGDDLQRHIEGSALPVYIVFFAVAGANLHMDVLVTVGLPAMLFVLVRGTGFLVGARLGARIAGAPPSVQRYAPLGLLPQAGLALALSLLFAKTFPELGDAAGTLTLGVVAINELVAPALYRLALVRSGEAGMRARAAPEATAPSEG